MNEIPPTPVAGALLCSFLNQDTPNPRMSAHVYYHGTRPDRHFDLSSEFYTLEKHLGQSRNAELVESTQKGQEVEGPSDRSQIS